MVPQLLQGETETAEEDYLDDMDLSEDEGMEPNEPTFQGLFKPVLFKSLLHKARVATNLGVLQAPVTQVPSTSGPHENLFKVQKPDQDFVPFPDLFSDVIQHPWGQPGSLAGPRNFDRRLYCSAPELDNLLQLPKVGTPISGLTSSSIIANDAGEGLKVEDKKAEMSFHRTHNASS